ncbi:FadR/GntR family transcriptional regulator [Mesorhizobium sp. ZC-5]|uniref:FadR/GntR family transcriptional regulator n=1 Tax=Mesorhizobium sp. ZC-5 TaxID=2986066 RepID=UPI0021E90B64|nr:FadR/GntR family transcriptional regulator [Mesorhizobium sp. ZC-5]MCV3242865.1 FadR family transcriptional regulator [Mesorhizobium sp. ZC-5]
MTIHESVAGTSAALMPRLFSDGQVRSAHSLVTHDIALGILRGDLPPDSLLPNEADLIDKYGVSRTALREAIKTLTAKGFLISKTKVGTRVLHEGHWNMYDPQVLTWRVELGVNDIFLQNIYEVRQAVEPAAAAFAAIRRTDEHLDDMRQFLGRMSAPRHTRESYAEPDLGFHQQVLLASGNPFMQSFSSVIEAAIRCSFQISAPVDSVERLQVSIDRHGKVLEAIADQDACSACEAMTQVIREGIENAHYQLASSPLVITMPLQMMT